MDWRAIFDERTKAGQHHSSVAIVVARTVTHRVDHRTLQPLLPPVAGVASLQRVVSA
ncbi:hypothetical protein MPS_3982 [Mycobacterium pseudoshottsii JCM 15466]|nr:hypothetical protein MPS_3982 [Mycobacterium pseudoshottsii JCM 15466]